MLPLAAPMTAYAATGSSTSASSAPIQTTNASQGLYVSGDVVLSGVCLVAGQYRPGQIMVFRAQVLETDGSTISDPTSVAVTANLMVQGKLTPVTMNYDSGSKMWVGTYTIPLTATPGMIPYTISAKDALGHTGLFVPLGMPPAIVNGTVAINLNGTKVGEFTEMGSTVTLYPILQMLKKEGLQVKWDGKTVSVNSPLFPTAKLPPATGSGPYSIVINGKTVFKTTGAVMKDPTTHQNTTYLSADVIGFLVGFFGHGNPQAASFTGYEFDINTQAAAAGASSASGSSASSSSTGSN